MSEHSPAHPDLETVATAVAVLSATSYAIRGETRELATATADGAAWAGDPLSTDEARPDDAAATLLLPALETELYALLYCRLDRPGLVGGGPLGDPLAQRAHLDALSAANAGHGTWEPGWRVVDRDDDGRVAVIKDQVTFWVEPSGLRVRRGKAVPGAFCRVRVGKELRALVPGFYVAIGDGDGAEDPDGGDDRPGPLVRLYWHLGDAAAAVRFIGLATRELNRTGIPFRTKVLADPAAYLRADAGVLYLEQRYYRRLRPALRALYRELESELREETPLFTRRLRPGLGLAEDPRHGMSFGQSRCRLVARGLWRAYAEGRSAGDGRADAEARAAAVVESFREAGLDPCRPWLEPGSNDAYALGSRRRSRSKGARR